MTERLLVALGGNALVRPGQEGTIDEQAANLRSGLRAVVEAVARGWRVIVTHGNGPQVGHLRARSIAARGVAYEVPLDVCVAQSQGETGYLIVRVLHELLARRGVPRPLAAVLTRAVVDPDDPAFEWPVKPIGPDRRLVPSPRPLRIPEAAVVRRLFEEGVVVVAAGGGGIPVVERASGRLEGVEGVVDKDLASALLALEAGVERMLILTTVGCAKLRFGRPDEQNLADVGLVEIRRRLAEGHFGPGTMRPKIEAAVRFLEGGGSEAVIAHLDEGVAAMDGCAGTRIIPDAPVGALEDRTHASHTN